MPRVRGVVKLMGNATDAVNRIILHLIAKLAQRQDAALAITSDTFPAPALNNHPLVQFRPRSHLSQNQLILLLTQWNIQFWRPLISCQCLCPCPFPTLSSHQDGINIYVLLWDCQLCLMSSAIILIVWWKVFFGPTSLFGFLLLQSQRTEWLPFLTAVPNSMSLFPSLSLKLATDYHSQGLSSPRTRSDQIQNAQQLSHTFRFLILNPTFLPSWDSQTVSIFCARLCIPAGKELIFLARDDKQHQAGDLRMSEMLKITSQTDVQPLNHGLTFYSFQHSYATCRT